MTAGRVNLEKEFHESCLHLDHAIILISRYLFQNQSVDMVMTLLIKIFAANADKISLFFFREVKIFMKELEHC